MATVTPNSADITGLLHHWQQGDSQAFTELSNHVHHELHRIARRYMHGERCNHTLQATALVNEAFIALIDADVSYENRVHFFCLAGRIMRRILVDHARSRAANKRGAGSENLSFTESIAMLDDQPDQLLALDSALHALEQFDAQKADILQLQFFAGLKNHEIADIYGVSARTIERNSKLAKAWLHQAI